MKRAGRSSETLKHPGFCLQPCRLHTTNVLEPVVSPVSELPTIRDCAVSALKYCRLWMVVGGFHFMETNYPDSTVLSDWTQSPGEAIPHS